MTVLRQRITRQHTDLKPDGRQPSPTHGGYPKKTISKERVHRPTGRERWRRGLRGEMTRSVLGLRICRGCRLHFLLPPAHLLPPTAPLTPRSGHGRFRSCLASATPRTAAYQAGTFHALDRNTMMQTAAVLLRRHDPPSRYCIETYIEFLAAICNAKSRLQILRNWHINPIIRYNGRRRKCTSTGIPCVKRRL